MTKNTTETFLDSGFHKVHSNQGKKLFDALLQIRNKEVKNIYLKNVDFRNGLQYEYDFANIFSDGMPKVIMPEGPQHQLTENYGVLKARVSLPMTLISKIKDAVNGGTDEKIAMVVQKENEAADEDHTDSGDE